MVKVRAAATQDIGLVAEIGAVGFYADPVMRWAFRDDAARLDQLRLVFAGIAGDFIAGRGTVDIGDDACVALWRDPTFDHAAADAAADEAPFDDQIMERLGVLTTLMAETHPHDPHWYLFILSTIPERQGQGLGSVAVTPVLERCDREGSPAYLESTNPRNMTLYRRLGFEQTGEIPLPDGPSLYPMWREPRGA